MRVILIQQIHKELKMNQHPILVLISNDNHKIQMINTYIYPNNLFKLLFSNNSFISHALPTKSLMQKIRFLLAFDILNLNLIE